MNRWIVHEVTLELPLRPDRNLPAQLHAVVDLGENPSLRRDMFERGKSLKGWAVRAFFTEEHDAKSFTDFLNALGEEDGEELLAALEGNDVPKAH